MLPYAYIPLRDGPQSGKINILRAVDPALTLPECRQTFSLMDDERWRTQQLLMMLFYQGRRSPYPWSLNWLEGFSDPGIARELYGNAFPLVDITVIPDDDIMQHRSMAALTLIQKHIRQRDMAQLLDKLAHLLLRDHLSRQQITVLVKYMAQAGEAQDIRTLLYGLAQRVPQHGEKLMTFAEELKLIGRKEGLQQGIQQGIQEGQRAARLEIARQMVLRGLETHAILEMTGLSKDELQQLQH